MDQEPLTTRRVKVKFEKGNPELFNTTGEGITNPVDGYVLEKTYEDGTIRYNVLDANGQPGANSDLERTDINDTIRTQWIQQQREEQRNPPISPETRAAEARTATATADVATGTAAERAANSAAGRGWVTDADYAKQQQDKADAAARLADINARIAAIQQQAVSTAETNALKRQELAQSAGQFDVTSGQNQQRIGIEGQRANTEAAQLGLTQQQIDISKSTAAFQQGPQFALEQTKQAFTEKQAQLSNLLAARKIDQDTALADMNNWWRMNVEAPYKQDEAARMRSAEERQLQQLQDQSAQFAATHSLNRASLGVSAGNSAVEQEISTFPYKGGPALGANMSSAINSLAHGSSAGVNFSPEDFTFHANLDETRKRATANALKNVSPYARNIVMQNGGRTSTPLPQVDFSTMPNFSSQGSTTEFLQKYYPSFIAQGGDQSQGDQAAQ